MSKTLTRNTEAKGPILALTSPYFRHKIKI